MKVLSLQVPWYNESAVQGTGISSDDIVTGAVCRAMNGILDRNFVPWKLYARNEVESTEPSTGQYPTYITTLNITQTGLDNSSTWISTDGEVDESYTLSVDLQGAACIEAISAVGVLRALETFVQLFYKHTSGSIYTTLAPVSIADAPKFPHRGILIDVARNFLPVSSIYRTLDAMAWNKLNRLHIHATDSQSWPLEIPAMPELSKKGAYSSLATYSPQDVTDIQIYAIQRGIEVIFEIDMPGHIGIVAESYPDLIVGWGAEPWSTSYFHTGGDEVNIQQYLLDPTVNSNETSVLYPLIQRFTSKNHARVTNANLIPIVWEEIPSTYDVTLGSEVVVQSWLGGNAVQNLTANGHKVIDSNYEFWYLDCGRGQWLNFQNGDDFATYYPFNDWCGPTKSWQLIYSHDPTFNLTEEQAKLVLGGEVAAWSETIDETNLDTLLWPRASAAGEVLWSGRIDASGQNRSQVEASPRLADLRERMVARGVGAAPVQMTFCTQGRSGSTWANRTPSTPHGAARLIKQAQAFRPLLDTRFYTGKMGLVEDLIQHTSLRGVSVFLVVSVVIYSLLSSYDKKARLRRLGGAPAQTIPGKLPFGFDIIKEQVDATMHHKNLEMWRKLFKDVPSYTAETTIVGRRIVFTADHENIKAILASQFADFGKGEPFHREWKEFLGDSIFTTDGDKWHASRQLIRPQFVKERISDLDCFELHLDTLFKTMANGGPLTHPDQEVELDAGNGKVIEISDLLFRYTLDVATDFLLGKDVQSLTNPREEFADAFNEVQRVQNIRARAGPLQRFVPLKSFRAGLKIINRLCNTYIERALLLSPEELASKTKSDQGYTFLHELASFTRDRTVLRDQLVAVLLAGRDTTAATLSWTIYELSRHPECVRKLREEIIDQVGLDRTPTYQDLKNMKYLQSVMNETLRVYPVVPFNVRLALRDCTLPRGGGPDGSQPIPVLKDTPIGYSTLVMQRREDLYPPVSDKFAPAEDFSPERWSHWQPKPWQYVPFNGGPRICIGQQFALTEMGYVLTRLFQKFERVESHMQDVDGGSPTLKAEIVLQPGDGVKVAFWEAKK
ncbi:putative cytochrome 52A4 [Xylariales sp. PMI_506]|nr:putative cytochrome 52A4 [Xylariales sp. PMI_506]